MITARIACNGAYGASRRSHSQDTEQRSAARTALNETTLMGRYAVTTNTLMILLPQMKAKRSQITFADEIWLARSDFFTAVRSCFNDMGMGTSVRLGACMLVACILYRCMPKNTTHGILPQRYTPMPHVRVSSVCNLYMCVCIWICTMFFLMPFMLTRLDL